MKTLLVSAGTQVANHHAIQEQREADERGEVNHIARINHALLERDEMCERAQSRSRCRRASSAISPVTGSKTREQQEEAHYDGHDEADDLVARHRRGHARHREITTREQRAADVAS